MKLTNEQKKRFWAKVLIRSKDECWEWQGAKRVGYGAFKFAQKTWGAHRIAYFLATGETPSQVCHHCDNPPCCNPKHLFGGTNSTNMKDAYYKGRTIVPGQKLTKREVLDILNEYKNTPNCAEIARRHAVAKNTVRRIISGIGWSRLTGIKPGTKLKHPLYKCNLGV